MLLVRISSEHRIKAMVTSIKQNQGVLLTIALAIVVCFPAISCSNKATVTSPTTVSIPASAATNPQISAQSAQQAEIGKRQQQLMQQQAQLQAQGNAAPSK